MTLIIITPIQFCLHGSFISDVKQYYFTRIFSHSEELQSKHEWYIHFRKMYLVSYVLEYFWYILIPKKALHCEYFLLLQGRPGDFAIHATATVRNNLSKKQPKQLATMSLVRTLRV